MQSHGPKRIYTPQSLEFWFGRMEVEWEGQFDATHVERGHAMYRDSEIREVELGATDAIIHPPGGQEGRVCRDRVGGGPDQGPVLLDRPAPGQRHRRGRPA
jgi:hypothetical protein